MKIANDQVLCKVVIKRNLRAFLDIGGTNSTIDKIYFLRNG